MSGSRHRSAAEAAVRFRTISYNSKLSPVLKVVRQDGRRKDLKAVVPRCASTAVAGAVTCPECPLKGAGCYAQSGADGNHNRNLDQAAHDLGLSSREVITAEVELIDRKFSAGVPQDGGRDGEAGRDLRLHVYGDLQTADEARDLAGAAARYAARGGGTVWSFTRTWNVVPRHAWGLSISVTASVNHPAEIELAKVRGYAAAIVVPELPNGRRSFRLPGTSNRILPCPAQFKDTDGNPERTCVKCRACLDLDLLELGLTIGFRAEGRDRGRMIRRLPVVNHPE